uniref:Putative secreted protein n=1 Tax=Rhipicephalus microplus TaxID=6941 RepID=A0A6G5A080_RHIMP
MRLSTLSCVLLSSAAAYHSSPSSATIHANSQPSLVQSCTIMYHTISLQTKYKCFLQTESTPLTINEH